MLEPCRKLATVSIHKLIACTALPRCRTGHHHLVTGIVQPEQRFQPLIVLNDGDEVMHRALDMTVAGAR